MGDWVKTQHRVHWERTKGQTHSKAMMKKFPNYRTAQLLSLDRANIRRVIGLMTGHCHLRGHLHKMGLFNEEPMCRLCCEEEETASHILFECVALSKWRYVSLGQKTMGIYSKTNLINMLLDLIKETRLF